MFNWWQSKPKEQQQMKETMDEEKEVDEEELAKQGFDPLQTKDIVVQDNQAITDFSEDYPGYLTISRAEIFQLIVEFKMMKGIGRLTQKVAKNVSIRRQLSKQEVQGRKFQKKQVENFYKGILTQQRLVFLLNCLSLRLLQRLPFMEVSNKIYFEILALLFPLYLNRATMSPNPLERFKLVVTSIIGSYLWTNSFLKPLNPVLGETLEATYNDGTQVWAEQILHHPPVSYFLIYGPNKSYKYYGYYLVEAKAGLNSLSIFNTGKRSIVFKDNQKIDFNFPDEIYFGTFMGTLRQETINKISFSDKENDLTLDLVLGKVKNKPSDYFKAQIIHKSQPISTVHGSYMSFINFDDVRYWDYREITPFKSQLESDHQKRLDLIYLKKNDIPQAQKEKEIIENLQRKDRKSRETMNKQNGKKH